VRLASLADLTRPRRSRVLDPDRADCTQSGLSHAVVRRLWTWPVHPQRRLMRLDQRGLIAEEGTRQRIRRTADGSIPVHGPYG